MNKNSGNKYLLSGFSHGGRRAGYGMYEDDYSEESYGRGYCRPWEAVRFPNDGIDPEELNGECIIIQKGKEG